jgi:hypothetical protein
MKRFTTVMMNVVAATMILIGNSSMVQANSMQTTDSLILKKAVLTQVNDDLNPLKISVPGLQAFKKADNEINRNMKAYLVELYNPKLIGINYEIADKSIDNSFFNTYKLTPFVGTANSDEVIHQNFQAENIKIIECLNFQSSDNQINNNFQLNF